MHAPSQGVALDWEKAGPMGLEVQGEGGEKKMGVEWSGIREGREGKVKGEEERGKRRGRKGEKGGKRRRRKEWEGGRSQEAHSLLVGHYVALF